MLADEPTGDLDAQSAEEILALLTELNRHFRKTIVMVTHDARAERYVETIIRTHHCALQPRRPNRAPSGRARA